MKDYILKSVLPQWHFDPATMRQLKLVRFFGTDISQSLTKGVCSGIISRLFSNSANKHLWAAYVFTTGDEDDTSADLQPHDRAALASVLIPEEWRPKRAAGMPSSARKALEELIADTLRDGSPFDDPLPEVTFAGRTFCFTGEFEFGTRKQCQEAVLAHGGLFSKGITRTTDILVIANDASPRWAHGGYGNKIEEAMIFKLQHRKPIIIPELYWRTLLDELTGNG